MNKFYIPFYYLIHSRLKSKTDQLSWLIIFIFPQLLITLYVSNFDILLTTSIFLVSQLTFNTLYEIGYLENDIKTTLNEKNPTKRVSTDEYDYLAKNYNFLVYSRYFFVFMTLGLLYFISSSNEITLNLMEFISLLLISRVFFFLHNTNRNNFNLITFSVLAITKYIFPFVLIFNDDILLVSVLLIILFPLLRVIEHSTHKRYNFQKFAKIVGNHDKFRVIYYFMISLLFSINSYFNQNTISNIFVLLSIYFLAYRVSSYILIKKKFYKRDDIKNKDLQVKD